MHEFLQFLKIGFEHITDITAGYDHLLFVLALSAIYTFNQWRNVLVLVTAFTVGHSLTLMLTVANLSPIPSKVIEWLIPFTIVLTCLLNLIKPTQNAAQKYSSSAMYRRYALAIFFGLIHGLGFANYLREILPTDELFHALLAFNVGLEIGQLVIVFVGLMIGFLLMHFVKISEAVWRIGLSVLVLLISLHLFVMQTINLVE